MMAAAPAPAVRSRGGNVASQAAEAFAVEHFRQFFARAPTFGTHVGFHEHDAELDTFSPESQRDDLAFFERSAELALRLLARPETPDSARDDLSFLRAHALARALEISELRTLALSPRSYGAHLLHAVHGLIHRDFAPLAERARSVAARLRLAPELFENARANLQRPPRLWTELALRESAANISFLQERVPESLSGLTVQDRRPVAEALDAACEAYRRFAAHLERSVLPSSRGDWRIGTELYARKLALEEMTETPLSELLAAGEAELERLTGSFVETARQVDPKSSAREAAETLGADHPEAGELLGETRATVTALRAFLSEREVVTVPEAPEPTVADSPAYLREWTFASMDTPGAYEQRAREAYYYVTLPAADWSAEAKEQHLSFYNRPSLWNTTVHEVYPGHYVQVLRKREADSMVRRVLWAASFGEGWAHYCEEMMLDVGLADDRSGKERARLRLAQLQDALLRACRYVAGIRMHGDGMTVDQATQLFVRRGFLAELPARREAVRGTLDPTYLVYTMGKLQILALREECKTAWGAAFSLKRFHDALLSGGSAPVSLHRRRMLPGTR